MTTQTAEGFTVEVGSSSPGFAKPHTMGNRFWAP